MLGLVTTFAPTGARAEFFSDGVYPPTGSACYGSPSGAELEMQQYGLYGNFLHAPVVVGVFWPGDQPHDPMVRSLFGDFVTDLFESEQWNVVMPQYFTPALEVDARPSISRATTSPF